MPSTESTTNQHITPTNKVSSTIHTPHYEQVPFEVPEGWAWCRLEELCSKFSTGPFGSMVHKSDYIDEGVPLVNPANIVNGEINNSKLMHVSYEKAQALNRYMLYANDILLSRRGDLTKCAVVNANHHGCLCGTGSFFLHLILVLPRYFTILYLSSCVQNILRTECVGATMDNLNQGVLGSIMLPIPSLEEQKRIIESVTHYNSVIDIIGDCQCELAKTISLIKSKILDLAIHGKLVTQDPADEPAIDLLRRINPKFTPCDNGQYGKLPKGWCLARLSDISDYGKCNNVFVEDIGNDEWVLELEDIEKGSGRVIKRSKKAERSINGVRHPFSQGQILYSKLRTYLNKVLVADRSGFCTTEIIPFNTLKGINAHYLCHVLRSPYFLEYTKMCGYGVKMPRLSTADALNGIIPIPPLHEQHRIVARIKDLFATLNTIQSSLEA